MSPAPVSQSITVSASSSRRLDERLMLRFPALARWIARAVWSLPPDSALRRRFLRRVARNTFEAVNRKDYLATFLLFDPAVVTDYAPGLGALGLPTRTTTRVDRMRAQAQWGEEWKEFRQDHVELVDLGGRFLTLSRASATGLQSGATPTMELGYLLEIDRGLIARERMFFSHAEAREAAGLPTQH